MKKTRKVTISWTQIITLCAVIFVLSYMICFMADKVYLGYSKENKLNSMNAIQTMSDKEYLLKSGDVDDNDVAFAESWIDEFVPTNVHEYLFEDHQTQIVIDNNVVLNSFNGNIVTVGGTTTSYLGNPLVRIQDRNIGFSLLHELGHACDGIKGANVLMSYPSLSDKFVEIYQAEKSLFNNMLVSNYPNQVNGYAISNSSEYFAEGFAQYLLNPDGLQDSCPKTYEYMADFVQSL